MGFKKTKYNIEYAIKATKFLLKLGYSTSETQKILDKKRLYQNKKIIGKKDILQIGEVELIEFNANNIDLKPLVAYIPTGYNIEKLKDINIKYTDNMPYFCIFNKPSRLLTHPKNLKDSKSILDSARYYFGNKCNPCHRLDYDTSGLILCSLDKKSEILIKNLFINKKIHKYYIAVIKGYIKDSICIKSDIVFPKSFGNLCIKGGASNIQTTIINKHSITKILKSYSTNIDSNSKAVTILQPIKHFKNKHALQYFLNKNKEIFSMQHEKDHMESSVKNSDMPTLNSISTNAIYNAKLLNEYYARFVRVISQENNHNEYTLVKLLPISGKTHQLRIHTSSIGHNIMGDMLYGIHPVIASFFLDSKGINNFTSLQSYLKYKTSITITNIDNVTHASCVCIRNEKYIAKYLNSMYFSYKFISTILSYEITTCLFSHHDLNIEYENIFYMFLLFFNVMPEQRDNIVNDMRKYYCGSSRLMLHSYRLEFLNHAFVFPTYVNNF